MQMALKRCKHFELGGDKKQKGQAYVLLSLMVPRRRRTRLADFRISSFLPLRPGSLTF